MPEGGDVAVFFELVFKLQNVHVCCSLRVEMKRRRREKPGQGLLPDRASGLSRLREGWFLHVEAAQALYLAVRLLKQFSRSEQIVFVQAGCACPGAVFRLVAALKRDAVEDVAVLGLALPDCDVEQAVLKFCDGWV